jgi:hypothetical protein
MDYRQAYRPSYYRNIFYTGFRLFIYLQLATSRYL